jgi:hypothetical protein
MVFYSYITGHGRALLADTLGVEDPFALEPAEIVERVLAAGYTPNLDRPNAESWPQIGIITEVPRDGQTFLVAVGRDAEEISMQEMRADPYEVAE